MVSGIQQFYSGKNVFITGSTGFVGIVLLEKLLRTIPNLGTVYILLRSKGEKSIYSRLEEIKNSPIFEKLLETKTIGEIFSNVIPIAGNLQKEKIGLSVDDKNLLKKNVDVVFHVAASINFSDSLTVLIQNNTLGTRRLANLCKEMKKLKAFVFVSSSFANSWCNHSEEKIYDLEINVDEIVSLVEKVSEQEMEDMVPKLLGNHRGKYQFSKYLAEFEVVRVQHLFPCTIVRPSIIAGIWQDPIPNMTLGIHGPHAYLHGSALGVCRRLPGNLDVIYDYIPVDIVANCIIAAGYHANVVNSNEVTIFNCASSTINPVIWRNIISEYNRLLHTKPWKSTVWYPYLKFVENYTLFKISAILLHFLPALFFDFLLLLSGDTPMILKSHIDGMKMLELCRPFTFVSITFSSEKFQQLHEWLSPEDKKLYNLDVSSLNWPQYFWGLTQGIKKYIYKEPLNENLQETQRKDFILRIANYIVQLVFASFLGYAFCSIVGGFSVLSILLFITLYHYLFNVVL